MSKGKEVKTREQMTRAEINRLTERGRKELEKVLQTMLENMTDREMAGNIVRIFENEYRLQMETNDAFFSDINAFLSERKSSEMKRNFFFAKAKFLKEEGRVAEVIAARYPDKYSYGSITFSDAVKPFFAYIKEKTSKIRASAGDFSRSAALKCRSFSKKVTIKCGEFSRKVASECAALSGKAKAYINRKKDIGEE